MIHLKLKFKPWLIAGTVVLQLLTATPVLADAKADGDKGIEEYRQGNMIEGLTLMGSAAKQGYAPAQVILAFILDHAENDKEAFLWYQKAAEQNFAPGLYGLGIMYEKGEGTDKDQVKAGELFKQSAELRHPPAMRSFAYALETGNLGFTKNHSEALQWYLEAAEAGDQFSMLRLKNAYEKGELGLAIEPGKAEEWGQKHQLSQEKQNGD